MTNTQVTKPTLNESTQKVGSIRLMTNDKILYQNLRLVFADSTKVIGELMQNARRAGAKKIMFTMAEDCTDFIVEDDGCGIHDLQDLLHNSSSGWNDATKETERPFGLGFLSTLYAADAILIESRGQQCLLDAQKVIALEPMDVISSDYIGQTRITLRNFKLNHKTTSDAIAHYARGFSVPVFLNGNEVARPHALDVLTDVQTISIGEAQLKSRQLEKAHFYFQGLPIQNPLLSGKTSESWTNVVHLDSSFEVTMPDRHALYDGANKIERIKSSMKEGFVEKLLRLKSTISAEEFIQHYHDLCAFNQLALLNDVPLLPTAVVQRFYEYPTRVHHAVYHRDVAKPVSQEAIANGDISLFVNLDLESDGHGGCSMAVQTLIYENNWLFMENGLDPDHWVYQSKAINMKNAEVAIVANSSLQCQFCGERIAAQVHILDQLKIRINERECVLEDPAVAVDVDGCSYNSILYLSSTANVEMALTQGSSYQGEYDYEESDLDTDTIDLTNLRDQLLGEPSENSVQTAILAGKLQYAPNCNRSTTVVSIHDGTVNSEPLQKVLQSFIAHFNLQVEDHDMESYINDVILSKKKLSS